MNLGNISFEQYRAIDALNSHYLVDLLRSPAHARHNKAHDDDTPSMAFGRAFHTAVLEPAELLNRYVAKPDVDARTKAGKAALAALPTNKEWLSAEDMARISGMERAIRGHKTARELLAGCFAVEQSLTWEMGGLPCKARLDGLGVEYVLDLKSTQDASKRAFERSLWNFAYHIQGAFYKEAALANGFNKVNQFIHIAVESSAPYGVAVYRMDEGYIEAALEQISEAMEIHRRCVKSGEWPSYPERIQDVLTPAWMVTGEYAE